MLLEHNFFINVSLFPKVFITVIMCYLIPGATLWNSCLGLFILVGCLTERCFLVVLLKSLKILDSRWAQVMKLTMSLYKYISASSIKATSRSRILEPDCHLLLDTGNWTHHHGRHVAEQQSLNPASDLNLVRSTAWLLKLLQNSRFQPMLHSTLVQL